MGFVILVKWRKVRMKAVNQRHSNEVDMWAFVSV